MTLDADATQLLAELVKAAAAGGLQLELGGLVSNDGNGTVTATLPGSSVGVAGIRVLNHYKPEDGDNLLVVKNGLDRFVVGSFSPRSASGVEILTRLYSGTVYAVTTDPLRASIRSTGVFDYPDVQFFSWAVPEVGDAALVLVAPSGASFGGTDSASIIAFPAVTPPPSAGGLIADPTVP